MNEFLSAILSFPTVFFTVLLLVIILYWLMVIMGAVGADVFHVGEAAGGAVEGKIEGVVGGAVEGKIEGVVSGSVEGHVEGATELDGAEGGGGFLAMLGFGKVPATLVISSLVLWSWVLCLLGARIGADAGMPGWSVQVLVPIAAVFFGGLLTGVLVRTIARFIVQQVPLRHVDLVGKLCTITTGRVDADFGQGLITEHGVDLTVNVRCDPPNSLRRNAQAVIVGYDAHHHFFSVEAYDQPMQPMQSLQQQVGERSPTVP